MTPIILLEIVGEEDLIYETVVLELLQVSGQRFELRHVISNNVAF